MRILLLTPRFPYPPDRGDVVRPWTVLSGLARRHEVWLACVDRVAPAPEHFAHVRKLCRDIALFIRPAWKSFAHGLCGLLRGGSLAESYFTDFRLTRTLLRWTRHVSFDAVFTYSSSLASADRLVPARRRVLDLCDLDSAKWNTYARRSPWPLSWLYRLEASRVGALESRSAGAHDMCLLVNEREHRKFRALYPDVPAAVMRTTLDAAEFDTAGDDPTPPPNPIIGMLGNMSYPPNVRGVQWFGELVWPRVRQLRPEAQWWIIGRNPSRHVRRWAASAGVTVTGYVPDVRPCLRELRVFLGLVDGDIGLQTKLVVAMAAGRPAVVRPDTAAGLVFDDPPPFLVADAPDEFATAVARLIADDQLWRSLSRRAVATVQRHYQPERQMQRLEAWLAGRTNQTRLRNTASAPVMPEAIPEEAVV